MAELKTKPTTQNAKDFLESITPDQKRDDRLKLLDLFQKATGQKPVMWGSAIVGFGVYHFKSERSSQEGNWPLVAFSPRKQNLTLYVGARNKEFKKYLDKLGKHKISGSCLHINKLSDIDQKVLSELIEAAFNHYKKTLL